MESPRVFFIPKELSLDEKEKILTSIARALENGNAKILKPMRVLFVDDIRFDIFYNSIVARKGNIEKMVIVRTNENVYLIVCVVYYYRNPWSKSTYSYDHYYLIGFDSNKLFIVKVRDSIQYHIDSPSERISNKVFKLTSNEIYRALGYDFDLASSTKEEEVEVDREGWFRVQGDLIIGLGMVNDITEAYAGRIALPISEEIARVLGALVANRIVNILNELGFSVEVDRGDIVIPGLSKGHDLRECGAICRTVMDRLDITDIVSGITGLKVELIKDVEHFDFDVSTRRLLRLMYMTEGAFGYRFRECIIRLDVNAETLRTLLLSRESILYDIVRDLEPQRVTLRHGRHLVIAERALPTSVTFTVKPGIPEVERDIIVSVSVDSIYSYPGLITVKHPEHGEIRLKLKAPSVVSVRNTDVHEEFPDRLNHYLIKKLIGRNPPRS